MSRHFLAHLASAPLPGILRFFEIARVFVRVIASPHIILSLLCGVFETPLYEFGV
jgi:hypothetical protein